MGVFLRLSFSLIFVLLFSKACLNSGREEFEYKDFRYTSTLDKIQKTGELVAVTDYNSTSYYIYKGKPMGYHYDLLKLFADHLGVKLKIVTAKNLEEAISFVKNHSCDLIAMDLTVSEERSQYLKFSEPLIKSRQVLVQRKPEKIKTSDGREKMVQLIKDQKGLRNKNIHVEKNTVFKETLDNISKSVGKISIVEEEEIGVEGLITKVANKEIDYTVCDEHVGLVYKTYYPNLDVSFSLSPPQKLAWAADIGSLKLINVLNVWLVKFQSTPISPYLYSKYFKNPKHAKILDSEYYLLPGKKISVYDEFIKKNSALIGWDWHLLAALIYQESQFQPGLTSWAGAYGLMQLMPETAANFGIDSTATPDMQILAGVRYIKYLDKYLTPAIPNKEERIKFILASYNAGLAHVLDARRLAKKYGKDLNVWDNNVDSFMIKKAYPKYYRDPVVYYGYSRGIESFKFVNEVLERYEHYKNAFKS